MIRHTLTGRDIGNKIKICGNTAVTKKFNLLRYTMMAELK